MLSLNIHEKHKINEITTNETTILDNNVNASTETETEKRHIKIKNEIDDNVKRILSGEFNHMEQEPDDMQQGGGMRGIPGMMGPKQGGFPGGSVQPYRTRLEALKAGIKVFGVFVMHVSGLLFIRQLSYRFSR